MVQWNDYYIKCWKHYFDFKGRARRSELLIFIAINRAIHTLGLQISDIEAMNEYVSLIIVGLVVLFGLSSFIPEIAVSSRRLHDIGQSGWWISVPAILGVASVLFSIVSKTKLIATVCLVAYFVSIICCLFLFLKDSQPGENKWGPNPKEENNLSQNIN